MKIIANTRLGFGPYAEDSSGVWTAVERLDGDCTAQEANALVGSTSPQGRKILAVRQDTGVPFAWCPEIEG